MMIRACQFFGTFLSLLFFFEPTIVEANFDIDSHVSYDLEVADCDGERAREL